jgi:hypothetical protein
MHKAMQARITVAVAGGISCAGADAGVLEQPGAGTPEVKLGSGECADAGAGAHAGASDGAK